MKKQAPAHQAPKATKETKINTAKTGKGEEAFKGDTFLAKTFKDSTFTKEQMADVKRCFDIFDTDKSGLISIQELTNTIKALGVEDQLASVLNIITAQTAHEELNFDLFCQVFGFGADDIQGTGEEQLRQIYEIFDPTGSGCFGPSDFAAVAESVGEKFSQPDVEQIIDYADKDRDGGINYDEFLEIVHKQFPKV